MITPAKTVNSGAWVITRAVLVSAAVWIEIHMTHWSQPSGGYQGICVNDINVLGVIFVNDKIGKQNKSRPTRIKCGNPSQLSLTCSVNLLPNMG